MCKYYENYSYQIPTKNFSTISQWSILFRLGRFN